MSLEHILEALTAEGQAAISRIEQEAEEQAGAILNQAEAEAVQIREEHIAAIRPRLKSERSRRINAARLAAQRVELEARESLVKAAFDAACEELADVRESPTYPALLEALMDEVFEELGTTARLAVDPRDAGLTQRILDQQGMELDIEPALDTWGGSWATRPMAG